MYTLTAVFPDGVYATCSTTLDVVIRLVRDMPVGTTYQVNDANGYDALLLTL